jgi:hypothetical protein
MERLFGIGLSIALGIGIGWYLFSGKVETVVEREVIVKYDTLILHRDTVIEHVERLQSMIVKYQTITDTVTKLQMCDTIVVKCDSLAEQYRQQDSLHREYVNDLQVIVSDKATENAKLQKKNRRKTAVIAALSGIIAGFTVNLLR